MDSFWSKVEIKALDDCWNWVGAKGSYGHGIIRVNGKNVRAHRLSLEKSGVTVPDDKVVCHKCDNPACVNPDHLFIGTQFDNLKDMTDKGRRFFKLNRNDAGRVKDMLRCGAKQQDIADWFGISNQLVSAINCGHKWADA